MAAGPRWVRSLRVATVLVVACVLFGWCTTAPSARASSYGNIIISPSSGPVGTQVTVDIRLYPSSPTDYVLTATTTDPAADGCASAQQLPDVPEVSMGPQGGTLQFNWPDALSQGPYWLCAAPADGSGDTAQSAQPFTVLAPGEPTPTVTVPTPAPSVSFLNLPIAGIPLGDSFTVALTDWSSAAGTPPTVVALTPHDPFDQIKPRDSQADVIAPFSVTAHNGAGNYALKVTVPATLAPGTYWLHITDAANDVYSQSFAVIQPDAVPTQPGPTQPGPTRSSSLTPLVIAVVVAMVLVIAIAILLVAALRKRAQTPVKPPVRW